MRYLVISLLLPATCLAGDDIEARLAALEKRIDAIDARLKKIEDFLAEVMERRAKAAAAADRAEDMNDLRNLVGLIVVSQFTLMKDGKLDVYGLVRKGDIEEEHFDVFRSARYGGPTNEEIKKGDYSRFPYERFAGDPNAIFGSAKMIPLLWDKKPDQEGKRLVAYNSGAVRALAEADLQALLKSLKGK